jgi:CcmD family protein
VETSWLNYAVMGATLTVWCGLFVAIYRLDRRVKRLERKCDED